MPTLGEIRMQLSKTQPGLDQDVLDAWILEGLQFILGELNWQRLDVKTSVVIPAEYNAGTVALTQGSDVVTGSGTAFTEAMSGRLFRVLDESDAYYQFTQVSATEGTLDRPYEGDTATGLSYRINQNVFQAGADCRGIHSVDGLIRKAPSDLPPARLHYGPPRVWTPYMDSLTAPPVMQFEVYPIPIEAGLLAVSYTLDAVPSSVDASASILPFVFAGAVKAYVQDMVDKDKLLSGTMVQIAQMRKQEAASIPPLALRPGVTADHRVGRPHQRRWYR